MAVCNVDTLLTSSCTNEFLCLTPQQARAVILQLLCNLSVNGGGGGGGSGQVMTYAGAAPPTEDPPDTAAPAIAYSEDGLGGPVFYWNVDSQVWM